MKLIGKVNPRSGTSFTTRRRPPTRSNTSSAQTRPGPPTWRPTTVGAGTSEVPVSAFLSGLTPNSSYDVRLVCEEAVPARGRFARRRRPSARCPRRLRSAPSTTSERLRERRPTCTRRSIPSGKRRDTGSNTGRRRATAARPRFPTENSAIQGRQQVDRPHHRAQRRHLPLPSRRRKRLRGRRRPAIRPSTSSRPTARTRHLRQQTGRLVPAGLPRLRAGLARRTPAT